VLDLVDKRMVTKQIILTIGYDIDNLTDPEKAKNYTGEITIDAYGRKVPKHAHGTINLEQFTSSSKIIINAVNELYNRITNPDLLVRRISLAAGLVITEQQAQENKGVEQYDLFTDYEEQQKKREEEERALMREKNMQKAMLDIKKKYGKNAVLKGMNLEEGATAKGRNSQIGGHRA